MPSFFAFTLDDQEVHIEYKIVDDTIEQSSISKLDPDGVLIPIDDPDGVLADKFTEEIWEHWHDFISDLDHLDY